ncbi:MAG: hypothetical protein JSW08_02365 [archaeon]|nr:MAG: hypothetical protein JSW08_02365 [archaeon]
MVKGDVFGFGALTSSYARVDKRAIKTLSKHLGGLKQKVTDAGLDLIASDFDSDKAEEMDALIRGAMETCRTYYKESLPSPGSTTPTTMTESEIRGVSDRALQWFDRKLTALNVIRRPKTKEWIPHPMNNNQEYSWAQAVNTGDDFYRREYLKLR